MTKKDYIKFAEMFVKLYSKATEKAEEAIVTDFCEELTIILQEDNPNFDYQRFVEYIASRRTGELVAKTV